WMSKRKWYFLFSTACLLLGWQFLTKNIAFQAPLPHTPQTVKVLTYNVTNASGFHEKGKKPKERLLPFFEYLASLNADIFCLQEFAYPEQQIMTYLDKVFGEDSTFFYGAKNASPLIISKHPILDKGALAFENSTNGCIYADIDLNGITVRVYNLHLKSNTITRVADEVREDGNLREKETWRKIRLMFAGYKTNAQIRAKQVQTIKAHMAQSPYPIIVCGDFNDVPQSFVYHTIAHDLIDHFQEKGRGIGTTFGGSIPFLRIDYVLTSSHFLPQSTKVIRAPYSDHFPVLAAMAVQEN
ncbi:MAG: endonuclease/exonuclease/phosphatase family protein, partial [Saprospiraceae bacterium]|nr:endonuclease/exonuclease/phosphatase family protein [Saprospiraceae bacterium]